MSKAIYHITAGTCGKYQIKLQAIRCGSDYSVTICGGERDHVGAVALGCDESDISGHETRGATVSILCALGHRDDKVAWWAAKYLATELKCTISVSAGIHVDNADQEEIKCLLENSKAACRQFVDRIRESDLGHRSVEGEEI